MSHSENQDVLPANHWQGQLDLDTADGAAGNEDTCWHWYWLYDDLTAWSSVMHAIDSKLYETKPKRLGLRFLEDWTELDRDRVSVARQESCLASKLLCQQICIEAFQRGLFHSRRALCGTTTLSDLPAPTVFDVHIPQPYFAERQGTLLCSPAPERHGRHRWPRGPALTESALIQQPKSTCSWSETAAI
ncbi:hypothetical protein HPB50_027153 [Hyalomma asiaticum]|uniref:Uncharacterized protein n=1 Tax=Hyalomma asiaticum TaxID=266040 RepID=A0ACB7TP29_HYAAI|nr:hypothetical protein HPB50_027153 [Hyalomma asiaticum]